jgi:glycolate oxidase iron-sulfur subunit
VLIDAELPPGDGRGLTVAYHAACSLQHGQQVTEVPKRLLAAAGYSVRSPVEAHLCCGSAGTYNILQPEIAGLLGDRKVANLARLDADVIATGNIGCAMQIGQRAAVPVVHTVELLDWATGGPMPPAMALRR